MPSLLDKNNAVAFEAAFAKVSEEFKSREAFLDFLKADLAKRSGVPVKVVEDAHVYAMLANKARDAEAAANAKGFVVFWKESRAEPANHKSRYARGFLAKRKAEKIGADYSSLADYYLKREYVLVENLMNKGRYALEAVGTPYYLSVGSETYWSS